MRFNPLEHRFCLCVELDPFEAVAVDLSVGHGLALGILEEIEALSQKSFVAVLPSLLHRPEGAIFLGDS